MAFEIMKKKRVLLTLLTDANLKKLYSFFVMMPFHGLILNFEKKNDPLLTKDFFS